MINQTNVRSEAYESALHCLRMFASTIVACRYVIPESLRDSSLQSQLAEYLELAIARTVLEHPLLQVGIAKEESKHPVWVQLDTIDLSQHIEWQTFDKAEGYDDYFDETISKHLPDNFSGLKTRPRWRLILSRVLNGDFVDVVLAWDHAHMDGMSGKLFHQTLIRQLQLSSTSDSTQRLNLENHTFKPTALKSTFTPGQETIVPFSFSLGFMGKIAWQELRPPMFVKDSPTQPTWAPIRPSPYGHRFRSLRIPHDILTNILSSCRAHKTTLTGLLHGIALVSLSSQLQEKQATAFSCETAIDLRRHIPKKPKRYEWLDASSTIANYVTKMSHDFDESLVAKIRSQTGSSINSTPNTALKEIVWLAAGTVRQEIQQRLDLGVKNDYVGLMKLLTDVKSYLEDDLKKPRRTAWLITNLGVIDGTPSLKGDQLSESWSIRSASFAVSPETNGPLFNLSPLAAKDGELWIDFTWQDGIVDDSLGHQLVADVETWIRYIASDL